MLRFGTLHGKQAIMLNTQAGEGGWELPAHYCPLVENRPAPSHLGGRVRSIMSRLKDMEN